MQAIAEIGDYIAYDGNAGTILHEGETFTDSGFAGSEFRSNSGTAIRVWLVTMPNKRPDINPRSPGLNAPVKIPAMANSSATPARVSATG